jgi:hypothetical protein
MHDTIRSISRFYVLSAIWLAITLGIGFAALGPVDVVLSGIDASPVVTGTTAMVIGVTAGTLVAIMLWVSAPVRRARRTADQR